MNRLTDDRRERSVAAVTEGPDSSRPLRFTEHHLELPVILVAALKATGTSVDAFMERLRHGSIWQDQSLRSPDRRIDIQAFLPPDGLRCVIRLERNVWYHHPLGTLHVWGMTLAADSVDEAFPLARILQHDLLDPLPIMVRATRPLNSRKPEFGIRIRVTMPATDVAIPAGDG